MPQCPVAERKFCIHNLLIDSESGCYVVVFYVYRKQDLAVSAPFYHAPMASGAVYVYSGKQVNEYNSAVCSCRVACKLGV